MTIDSLTALYHSGGLFVVALVATYGGLKWLSTGWAWLAIPKRAHYVTAIIGGLGVIAVPASQGTTPNLSMILTALGTMIALFAPGVNAPPVPAPNADTSKPPGGFARLILMPIVALIMSAFMIAAAALTGCNHAGQVILNAGQCILDSSVMSDVLAVIGTTNYVAAIAAIAAKDGPTLVTCVLNAIAAENSGSGSGSGSGSAVPVGASISKIVADAGTPAQRALYLLQNPSLYGGK